MNDKDTKTEEIKDVVIDIPDFEKHAKHQKNTKGDLGPICNNCGGFGYTLTLSGESSSAGCQRCNQTGVEPPDIYQMAKDLHDLKRLIIKLGEDKIHE